MQTLPQDPVKLMSLVGALCSDLGAHDQALSIFQHLVLLRGGEANALVSLALAQSRSGDDAGAVASLRLALADDPAHDMARVMLAVHLHDRGDPGARHLLGSVMADARDADALALARSVEGEILGRCALPEPVRRVRYTRVGADQPGDCRS